MGEGVTVLKARIVVMSERNMLVKDFLVYSCWETSIAAEAPFCKRFKYGVVEV
jgi:hypothetical protein